MIIISIIIIYTMKIKDKQIKMVEYFNKNLYIMNNIDDEILNHKSEFNIGSITKLFIIISILLLHQMNKLNINDNIYKYIKNKNLKNIKIIDIINHKSGLKNWYDIGYGGSKIKFNSSTEVYNHFINEKINTGNKNIFSYSNIGYIILGVLIETITD